VRDTERGVGKSEVGERTAYPLNEKSNIENGIRYGEAHRVRDWNEKANLQGKKNS